MQGLHMFAGALYRIISISAQPQTVYHPRAYYRIDPLRHDGTLTTLLTTCLAEAKVRQMFLRTAL
jgi:hypothetical protein